MSKFIRTTIGLVAHHENFNAPKLARVEYYENADGTITLKPVSAHNLNVIRKVKQITLSRQEYVDIPEDTYDDTVEAIAALRLLGFEV